MNDFWFSWDKDKVPRFVSSCGAIQSDNFNRKGFMYVKISDFNGVKTIQMKLEIAC
jgi:hypothetical protein